MSTPETYIAFRQVVGNIIANRRAAQGYTQAAFAMALGMTQANMSRLETGEAIVTIEQLAVIAEKLGIMPSVLVQDAERATQNLRSQGQHVVMTKGEAPPSWEPLAKVLIGGAIVAALLNSK